MGRILVNKPYVICHMTMSLDGKIAGSFLSHQAMNIYEQEYYRLHRQFSCDAFLCGRVTMEGSFTHGYVPDLSSYHKNWQRRDHIASKASFYAVAIDSKGKLGWQDAYIHDDDPGYDGAHIIEVLSENVSDGYLSYLREKGISYIFAGKDQIDLQVVCQKLYDLFDIHTLLLEGGGLVNGSFLEAQLIDEMSVILVPIVDGSQTRTLFEGAHPKDFKIKDIQKIDPDGLWLRYVQKSLDIK